VAILDGAMLRRMRPAGPPTTITPRMREVLALMAEGMTNREIAYELGLSPFTVKNYIERIYERMGALDRVQAVSKALREGIIE
jgi:two-component system, NarL family, nitrate/nitrite response regulator NarL